MWSVCLIEIQTDFEFLHPHPYPETGIVECPLTDTGGRIVDRNVRGPGLHSPDTCVWQKYSERVTDRHSGLNGSVEDRSP